MNLSNEKKFRLGMIATSLLGEGKGLLDCHEADHELEGEFKRYGIENTPEMRRRFREHLFNTDRLYENMSGAVLNSETFAQRDSTGKYRMDELLINKGIYLGIMGQGNNIEINSKEMVPDGIGTLDARLKEDINKNVKFVIWKSAICIGADMPSPECVDINVNTMAMCAKISHENGCVPILEPEIKYGPDCSLKHAGIIQKRVFSCLIKALNQNNIYMPGVLLKTTFLTHPPAPGLSPEERSGGLYTFDSLLSTVPCAISGILFLSDYHTVEDSSAYLKMIYKSKKKHTWSLSFCFGTELTSPFLAKWGGDDKHVPEAQLAFYHKIRECFEAARKE